MAGVGALVLNSPRSRFSSNARRAAESPRPGVQPAPSTVMPAPSATRGCISSRNRIRSGVIAYLSEGTFISSTRDNSMKAYLITTGTLFGLIAVLHLVRAIEERSLLATDPWYFLGMAALGVVSAAL